MALEPPDDLIELPPEVMAQPEVPDAAPPLGFGPPPDLVQPPTVPYGGGLAPDQNPTLNSQQKNFLSTTAVGRVMDAFGQGFSETFAGDWGIQPKDMQRLREEGLFFRPEQEMSDPIGLTFQAFAESVIAPAAKAGDFALRLGLSPLVATARALGQASQETGLAATLGYRPSESGRGVSDDIIGAVDTLGLMFGMHVPTAPGALVTRRERIAGRERLMPNQVPTPGPHKPVQPPEVMPPSFSEPDVVPRPPGAVAAAEVPTTVAARVEAPGPSVQIGEQRVVFPDENHAALFEYGEAIAHGERPAVAGELATEFGQQGAANIDAVAQAYYDRVATKIESTAGEIAAGRVDEPGPATFRTTPAGIVQEHALEVAQLEREAAELAVRPKGYGDANALVKTSEADEARALLNSSVQRLTSGIDPEQVLAGVKLALYHIEAGARSFAAYSKAILEDLGEWARPYMRDWYDKASRAIAEFAEDEFGGAPPRLPRSQRMRPPPPEMHSNRAGNINLDRINAPDDVMNVIREIADQNAGFPDVRRGRMTFEDIRNLADAAGMDARVLAKRGAGTAFNAEEAVRLRDLLVTSATHVQELSRKAIGASDEDLLKFQQALTRHAAIQEQVAGVTAEAGRALASFNIKAAEVERAKALTDLMDRFGGRATLEEKAAAIRNLNDPEEISRTIRKMEKATTMDMIVEAWMNGLLSGPLTHATNMVSNTLTNLANIAELGVAAGIGAAREAAGIGGRERIFAGEVGERVFSMVQGAQEGVIAARQAFADDAAASLATGKLDVRRPGAIPSVTVDIPRLGPTQVGGATVRIPSRLLSAEDAFFQTLAKRQETSALAYRKAMQEGLSGEKFAQRVAQLTADPTKEMLDEIGKSQTYLTFTKPLGPQGRKIQSAINHYPAMRFLVPFLRTPTNIIKYAGERTVLSSFSKEVRANLSGRNGQVAQDTQLARLTIGTAITVSALYWASSGMITGGGPSDPRARALLYATGWQPYSVKVGDTYYSYLRPLGPFGILLGVSADAAEISDRADQTDLSEIGKLAFASATTNLLNQTWLQGPSDLAQALNDPERYGESYVQSLTSSLVPSILAQEARNQDPYLREARGIIDGWKSRIPGLSTSLLPRRDIWGEPIRREGGLGPDRLSPIYLTAIKSDFISREMLRLGVWKSQPARSIRGVELTDEQYGRFQQTSGRLTRQALSTVVGRPGWDQIPAYAQANLINRLFDRARESARSQMMISDPDLLSKIIQTGVAEVVSEPESAGLIKYPPMPAVPTGAQ